MGNPYWFKRLPETPATPHTISILAELIHNASKRTQIIVATQSPALIDNFSIEDVLSSTGKPVRPRLNV